MQLLKNREEALTAKAAAKGKEGRRARQRTDDVESMDRVQLLGEAFQKIQAATGITVRLTTCQLCPFSHVIPLFHTR